MVTKGTASNYLVQLMNDLGGQIHDVGQLHERDQTSFIRWKNILQAKALEHDHRIDGIGKFVNDNNVNI